MNTIYPTAPQRATLRKLDLIITFAFLFSLIFSLPAASVHAQSADTPPTPQEEVWAQPDSLNNQLYLPYVNSAATNNVPTDVIEQAAAEELVALGTNIVRCNERSSWLSGRYAWSSLFWNTVTTGCPNIYVNPSVSGYVQVVYYSKSQGRWVWKPYKWVSGGTWTQMGNNFSAGTSWYARFYNVSSQSWVLLKTTSGRLLTSTPSQPQPGNQNDLLTHSQAVNMLRSGGITQIRSTGGCSDKNVPTCTSLDGIRRGSIQGLIDFKSKCDAVKGDCTIAITGGTETGHSGGTYSHSNGHKIDISWSFGGGDNFAGQFIKSNFTPTTTRGTWGEAYVDPATGYLYVLHGPVLHWDICFSRNC